jgi:hypothetical protein
MSKFKFFEPAIVEESGQNVDSAFKELKLYPNKNQRYEIAYTTKFSALGELVAHVQTKITWLLKAISQYEDGYMVDIEVLDHRVSNANPAFNQMLDFLKIFNYPTEMLVVKLNKLGVIERVLNQEEILERWDEIKSKELKSLEQTAEDRQLLLKGDVQFSNTLQAIKESFLHNLFFGPLYNTKSAVGEKHAGNVSYLSQLFQGVPVNYLLNERVLNINSSTVAVSHAATANHASFKSLYDQQYKALCGDEFNYQNFYKANYELDTASGLINSCTANFLEKANNKLYFEADYTIKRI